EIDGKAGSKEWKNGALCTEFAEYKRAGKYMENFPAGQQTRVRFYHDVGNLYCMVDFQKDSGGDEVQIFIAKDSESKPETLTANLQKKSASFTAGEEGVEAKVEGTKMEIRVPLAFLGLKAKEAKDDGDGKKKKKKKKRRFGAKKDEGAKGTVVCVNLTRKSGGTMTFWRGNSACVDNPVTFASFVLSEE
ncbi:MAG: hypothetical protein ACYTAF_14880, partial [Planctomycetota bacterium]